MYQVLGSGANTRLVIQWNDVVLPRRRPAAGGLTFQAVLGIDGSIRFNYQNLSTGNNGGIMTGRSALRPASRTTGYQGPNRLLLMYNNGPTTLVDTGTSVFIAQHVATADYYSFTVTTGETDTLVVTGIATPT